MFTTCLLTPLSRKILPGRPARDDRLQGISLCAKDQRLNRLLELGMRRDCVSARHKDPPPRHVSRLHHELALLLHCLDHFHGTSADGKERRHTEPVCQYRRTVLHICLFTLL